MPEIHTWQWIATGSALAAGLAIGLLWWFYRRRDAPLPGAQEFVIDAPNLRIQGVRYARLGAPVVILVHGYAGNSRNWREMGYRLHDLGFDVWMPNLRGHGKGSHRTTVISTTEGAYGFTPMVLEDYPQLFAHIRSKTGRRPTIVAHSMGGIAARAFLSGVTRDNHGTIVANEDLARKRTNETTGLILVGSPPHFHNIPVALKWLMNQPSQLIELLHLAMPVPKAGHAPTAPDKNGFVSRALQSVLNRVDKTLQRKNLIRSVAEVKNFNSEKKEFSRLLEKGLSKVHLDMIRDMNRWIQDGNVTDIDGFNFSLARPLYVPLLFVAAELDGLAPSADIFENAIAYRPYTEVRTALFRDTSHVDLISGERAANLLAPIIAKFAKDPNSLGPDHVHLKI